KSFSTEELRTAGFVVLGPNATQAQQDAAGRHNWKRLNQLFNDEENNYIPFSSWTYLQQLTKNHPDVGKRFSDIRENSRDYYKDIYRRAMREEFTNHRDHSTIASAANDIYHNHWAAYVTPPWLIARQFSTHRTMAGGSVDYQSGRVDYLKELSAQFRKKFDERERAATTPEARAALAQEQWDFLYNPNSSDNSRLPGIIQTLGGSYESRAFMLNNLLKKERDDQKGLTEYALWTEMHACETGSDILMRTMPDKYLEDMAEEAKRLLVGSAPQP
ncbi:MAG: hypothetical protein KDD69_12155, partial [Bdellovibrionales bacterium]|nr:hypothetical protein [Bdellovibrionales bacterium]